VGRWRTKAVAAVVALVAVPAAIAAVVVQSSGSSSHVDAARHARLLPISQDPLRVKGAGFQPRERVRLRLDGDVKAVKTVSAGARGTFVATFRGVSACGSVTVTARGSRGSRASFNLAQIMCP
jgi:hypothetical protein